MITQIFIIIIFYFVKKLMKIEVYLKNNVYTINCGTGAQKIKGLIEAASLKLDENMMFSTGFPKFARLEDGTQLNLNERIS